MTSSLAPTGGLHCRKSILIKTRGLRGEVVAEVAGIHRLTLLRWIRSGKMPDVSRDRNGWRIFSEAEAEAVVAYATSVNARTSPAQTVLFRTRDGAVLNPVALDG